MADYNIDNVLENIFSDNSNNWKPSDKIPLINKEIEFVKDELKSFLSESGFDIVSILNESNELCKETNALLDDMKVCKQEIELETMADILQSIESHETITKELQSVNFALNIVMDVVQCGKYVKEFDDGREAQSFSRAVEAVYDLLQYIEMPAEGFNKLDLYNNTKHTAQLILDSLLTDLYGEWERLICTSIKPESQKTTITITLNLDDSMIVVDVLNALHKSKKLASKVMEFKNFLLKDVLIPVMNYDAIIFADTDELLTITINHAPEEKPPYDAVLSNLRLIFQFLSNKLNMEYHRHCSIMKLLGAHLAQEFTDTLIKECLIDTIPNNINDLQTYGRITSEIEDFQRFLNIIKFFPDNNDISVLDYIKNIDVLFAKKCTEHILETARDIMFKDLSDTMSIGIESIPNEDPSNLGSVGRNEEEAIRVLKQKIPKSLFYFPRCMISKTAQELLDLVYGIMEQAVQCTDIVCEKLYDTSRLVFELYDGVVPYHHEKYLQTIPQYVALFHNNCMYLAHSLLTFGDKWMMQMEGRDIEYAISFVDISQKLRSLGYKHLTEHMQQQRKQILDNIRSSDLNCIVVKDVLSDNAEAAVRQCLRQLHLLKNVWIGVFPNNVFTRLMATLVNMFVEELIHRVCSVEDISMEMATQLTDMYTLVVQKAPHLFQNSSDIEEHVKSWIKLQELIFVLGGSLKDIEIHWRDGTGPLAIHFRTEELRNLIKALFQNTQFRANLLAKIK